MPKHMPKKTIDILVVALGSPFLIGLYENKKLFKTIKSEKHTSDELPRWFKLFNEKYNIEKLFYAKGPGSFMSIKVAYIFLKSFAVLKNIQFLAIDAFYFNDNSPIKAVGKLYFVKINNQIDTIKIEDVQKSKFVLPKTLKHRDFGLDVIPQYGINAIF